MSDRDLSTEAHFHHRARAAMATMRSTTAGLMDTFEDGVVEARKNRFADDAGPDHHLGFAMAQHGGQRLEDLADRDVPLFFGRLWLDSGEDYHLGRRHVRDEHDRSTPLVVDWRAPVAERYYRASPHRRIEVSRRRRFGFSGTTLTGFEDEDLRGGQDISSQILTTEIERPRTGPMRDIVATIQPEQDELIRRESAMSLCVQGAPGTGKTAVGLHRAAWLLYTYPDTVGRAGMLVVGPNESFLGYIAHVLPTLGESSVWQMTVDDLIGADGVTTTEDHHDSSTLKQDARMAHVCERAVWDHLAPIDDALTLTHAGVQWQLDATEISRARERARAKARSYDAGRTTLQQGLVHAMMHQFEARSRRPADKRWVAELKRHPAFKACMDAVWPRLTARQVLRRVYEDAQFRAAVSADLLSAAETDVLHSPGPLRPSGADVLLLDEIQSHLRTPSTMRTYGHVVIDEAQDLSPMQCRAIARRCPTGSLTVLGDLAQGTTPWAARDWTTQIHHLGRQDVEHTELTTGFRVPAVIIDLANRVLPQLGVDVSPARSIRTDGSLEVQSCPDLAAGTREAVEKALTDDGLVGVIGTDAFIRELGETLAANERVQLVPARLAKGLEFDHVVVCEPRDFIATTDDPTGLRLLYVALTRAVTRLTIVHTQPLPIELLDVA